MASPSDRTDETPWDELEQGFFAAAPPDVPEPPPEPMRFDDLDPVAPPRPERRLSAWRASATVTAAVAWQKLAPGVAAAAVVSRRSALRLASLARIALRAGEAQLPKLLAVFQNSSRQTRVLAAGVAALVAVTGVSAGVVASRGNGRTAPALVIPIVSATTGVVACHAPPPPVALAMTVVPDEDPLPASASIATAGPRKRKQTKVPARQAARAKAAGKSPSPTGRPTPAR